MSVNRITVECNDRSHEDDRRPRLDVAQFQHGPDDPAGSWRLDTTAAPRPTGMGPHGIARWYDPVSPRREVAHVDEHGVTTIPCPCGQRLRISRANRNFVCQRLADHGRDHVSLAELRAVLGKLSR